MDGSVDLSPRTWVIYKRLPFCIAPELKYCIAILVIAGLDILYWHIVSLTTGSDVKFFIKGLTNRSNGICMPIVVADFSSKCYVVPQYHKVCSATAKWFVLTLTMKCFVTKRKQNELFHFVILSYRSFVPLYSTKIKKRKYFVMFYDEVLLLRHNEMAEISRQVQDKCTCVYCFFSIITSYAPNIVSFLYNFVDDAC